MLALLPAGEPDDYVVATGRSRAPALRLHFKAVGLKDRKSSTQREVRPAGGSELLVGDATKAREKLDGALIALSPARGDDGEPSSSLTTRHHDMSARPRHRWQGLHHPSGRCERCSSVAGR